MKTLHVDPPSSHSLTPAQRRFLATVRLAKAICKVLAPLILWGLLGFPPTTDASAHELGPASALVDHGSPAAAVTEGRTIETHLQCALDEQGRPAPPCKQCEATTKTLTTATGTTSGARVDFTFRSDQGLAYVGEIEIEVRRLDGTKLVVHEDFVTVIHGQTLSVDLCNGQSYNFDQVDLVIYRLLTPQSQPQ